ncbi:MAG: sugar ABC transporter ATP-binding protein, partial [Rhodobiaceae bacterium]|nr:sugar ABC transporter ATP-binding protein [Rhodobiaceae bacterium]
KDGYIEQIGSPIEVFSKPENVFVATFIGSPPMNIIYCDIVKSQNKIYFKIDDQLMMPCLESKYDLIKEKEKIIIGIRSEDIVPNISKDSQSTYWNFDKKIDLSEPLGTETQLFFRFGEKEIISRMYNPRPIKVGEKISFEIDLNKVHLFDNKSQKAL